MRSIRNQVYLNKRNVINISNFYNFSISQETQTIIIFYIFSLDHDFSLRNLTEQFQFISLLRTIEEINDNGINMMALNKEYFKLDKYDDSPIIVNFIYSQRQNEDLDKNKYGWPLDDIKLNQHNRKYEVQLVMSYLQNLSINFKSKSQLIDLNNVSSFYQVIEKLISRQNMFESIRDMIDYLQEQQIPSIIQIPMPEFLKADIAFFYKQVKNEISPFYTKLIPHLEKFIYSTQRYEIESKVLIAGMKIYEVIGKGGFGRVNRVIFEDQQYASKISSVSFNSMTQDYPQLQLNYLCLRIDEINLLNEIQDYKIPYVIYNKHLGFKFVLLNKQGVKSIKIFNLSPIYKPFSVVQAQSEQEKIKFAEKIAICLKLLEMKRISHQNIKPENILVDEQNNPVLINFDISISNFGSSEDFSNIFTQIYADPELEKIGQQSRKNDVYSFGVTLYDLFVGKRPFHDASYNYDIEFLDHKTHQEEISKIKLPEIQQLIQNCVQPVSAQRFSLSQVLFQFLMIRPSRVDVIKLLKAFMKDFQDVDISEQEYELIGEFSEISSQMPSMDTLQIKHVQVLNDTLYRCQYQDNYNLLFHKYQIAMHNNESAFLQILQCMRFIRNLVQLNRLNVDNIAQFFNYRLVLQEGGSEKFIQFNIFSFDKGYIPGLITTQKQLIVFLQTIQQINENGISMMALANEFLHFQNDVPILTNFLFSVGNKDDLLKNQFGWLQMNTVQTNFSSMGIQKQQFYCLKHFFEQIIINIKTMPVVRKQIKRQTQFVNNLESIISKIEIFQTIQDMINEIDDEME